MAPALFITTMDLCKGYYQVPLEENSKKKTAFITPQGKFKFNRMPVGLKNAPAVFQRLMNGVLQDLPYAAAYIDDVVVASNSWEEHLQHLKTVLERIREAGLTLKLSKCVFRKAEISFLGHHLGRGKVKPQATKIEAVRNFPQPATKKDMKVFLGLVGYYRRFIPQFASHSAQLTDATGKKCADKIQWTDRMKEEFEYLKEKLADSTELHTFNPQKETLLHTDASDRGIGGVLIQLDERGEEVPIAFFSKKLLPRQVNYTVSEKECLAVVEAIKHFEAYLLGAHFTLVTDHKALLALPKTTSGGARITRWALALQPFDFKLVHKPGKRHLDADRLSRQGD